MNRLASILPLVILALQGTSAKAGPSGSIYGVWRNPHGTIAVKIAPCGAELCGTVARASPEAQRDARRAGVSTLIGMQLLRNYRQVSADRWDGRVYVPDIGGTYSSHIVRLSPTAIRISGCLMGAWLCKSQLWTRG